MSTPDPSPDMPRTIDLQFEMAQRRITFMPSKNIVLINIRNLDAKLEDSREHILLHKEHARELFNWLGVWLHK